MPIFHLNALLGDVTKFQHGPLSNLLEHHRLKNSSEYSLHKIANLWDGFDVPEDKIGHATLDHCEFGVISEVSPQSWCRCSTPQLIVSRRTRFWMNGLKSSYLLLEHSCFISF